MVYFKLIIKQQIIMSYYNCRCGNVYNTDNYDNCNKCGRKPIIIEDNDNHDEDNEYDGKNSSWWQSLKNALGLTRKSNNEEDK